MSEHDNYIHKYIHKNFVEVEIPQRTGLIVIAMEKQTERGPTVHYDPQSTTMIHEKDELIVLGDIERVDKLHKLLLGI